MRLFNLDQLGKQRAELGRQVKERSKRARMDPRAGGAAELELPELEVKGDKGWVRIKVCCIGAFSSILVRCSVVGGSRNMGWKTARGSRGGRTCRGEGRARGIVGGAQQKGSTRSKGNI